MKPILKLILRPWREATRVQGFIFFSFFVYSFVFFSLLKIGFFMKNKFNEVKKIEEISLFFKPNLSSEEMKKVAIAAEKILQKQDLRKKQWISSDFWMQKYTTLVPRTEAELDSVEFHFFPSIYKMTGFFNFDVDQKLKESLLPETLIRSQKYKSKTLEALNWMSHLFILISVAMLSSLLVFFWLWMKLLKTYYEQSFRIFRLWGWSELRMSGIMIGSGVSVFGVAIFCAYAMNLATDFWMNPYQNRFVEWILSGAI